MNKIYESYVGCITESADIEAAYDDIEDWMSDDLQSEFFDLVKAKDKKGLKSFIRDNADEQVLRKFKVKSDSDLKKLVDYIVKKG